MFKLEAGPSLNRAVWLVSVIFFSIVAVRAVNRIGSMAECIKCNILISQKGNWIE